MKNYFSIAILFIATLSLAATDQIFGAKPRLTEKPLLLSQAVSAKADPEKLLKIQGRVTSVCQAKGCWMVLQDGKNSVRVTFKDYGFFVPKNISGKNIILEGKLQQKVTTEAEARHFAKDEGKPQSEIEKIKGDVTEYSIIAESVLIPASECAQEEAECKME